MSKQNQQHGESIVERLIGKNKKLAKAMERQEGLAAVASALLQLRVASGLTQAQFAKQAGISKTMICEIENAANTGVTLRTLSRIAKAGGARLVLSFDCDVVGNAGGTVTSEVLGDFALMRRRRFTVVPGRFEMQQGLAA